MKKSSDKVDFILHNICMPTLLIKRSKAYLHNLIITACMVLTDDVENMALILCTI